MAVDGHRLGIDFGTSSTVAVLAGPDGRERQLLFGETPVMPSAVYLDPDGTLLVGADALRSSRARPEYFEPNPKARIDDGILLLGDQELPIVDVIAAVLRRVHDEAVRIAGAPIRSTVLSHPAAWAVHRRGILQRAGAAAGLPDVSLVAEPVAAAAYFVQTLGNVVPVGACIVIYDLGAGTFDASVVRRTPSGYTVLAEQGIADAGGLDLDAAVFAYLGTVHAGPDWDRLTRPLTTPDRRASRLLWDDVRNGKEALSRASNTTIFVPLLDADVVLGREQLEQLARPLLDRTVLATAAAIRSAGVTPSAVFLVGGASRMPLVATLLHRALGFPPTAIEQPQLVVAGGSLRVPETQHGTTLLPAQPDDVLSASGFPVSAPPGASWPVSGAPLGGSGEAWAAAAEDSLPGVPAEPAGPADAPVSAVPAEPAPAGPHPPRTVPPSGSGGYVAAAPVSGGPGSASPVSGGPASGGPVPGGSVAASPVSGGPGSSPVSGGPVSGGPVSGGPTSGGPTVGPPWSAAGPPPAVPSLPRPVSPGAVGRVSMQSPPPPTQLRQPVPGADDTTPPNLGRRRFLQVAAGVAGVAVIGGVVYAAKALGSDSGDGSGSDDTTTDDTTTDDGSTPDDGDTTSDDETTPDDGETTDDSTPDDTETTDGGDTPDATDT